ncbi:hypothetical protein STXM2123_3686 [Streptomyces sp. F-3]|nr:hypothetical protein STXM2123_3686 [Streptomyces sp. F-3]
MIRCREPGTGPVRCRGAGHRGGRSDRAGSGGRCPVTGVSGVRCVRTQGGGGSRRGAPASDDNAARGAPTPVQGSGGACRTPRPAA